LTILGLPLVKSEVFRMQKRFLIVTVALAVASLALPASALAAGTITNGSFEEGPTVEPFETLAAGSPVLSEWTIVSGSVDAIGGYWQASQGSWSLDLNGNDAGTISHTISTTVGATYDVAFDLSGNPDGGPMLMTLDVSATGVPSVAKSFDTGVSGNTRAEMNWTEEHYVFVATDTNTVLTFASTMTGSPYGPALDNVTITETPPATTPIPTTKDECKTAGWIALADTDAVAFKNQGDCVSYVATGGRNPAAGTTANAASLAAHTKAAERHAAAVASKKIHTETTHSAKSKHQKSHSPSGKK
jgi:choice-of-anchor C domain-containing protein